jgi:hypothetical protein
MPSIALLSKPITLPEESMNTRSIIGTVLFALALVLLPGCDEILAPDGTLTPIAPAPTILSSTPTLVTPVTTVAPTAAPTATPFVQRPGIVFGAQINPDEIIPACNTVRQLGIKATTLWLRWSNIEPRKGVLHWDDADIALQNFINCGVNDLGIHFLSKSDWATLPPPTTGPGVDVLSMPPRNMDDYYNIVANIATHFKGRVRRYSVENEAMSPASWSSSTASYFDLLKTAQRAIKTADPDALVVDGGTGGRAYGLLLASQLLQSGQGSTAVQYANDYYAHYAIGAKPPNLKAPEDLQAYFNSTVLQSEVEVSSMQRMGEWMPLLYSKNTIYDINQVHYDGPWQKLTDVINFVRTQLTTGGQIRPLEFWELGYGWQDRRTYDYNTHAQDMVKLLAIAAGEGVTRIIYRPLVDKPESSTPGLVKGDQLTVVGAAYRLTTQMLAGSTVAQHVDLGNHAVWAYRFSRGGSDTYVVWSTTPAAVRIPIGTAKVLVTDISGRAMTLNPQTITVTHSPLFIQAAP